MTSAAPISTDLSSRLRRRLVAEPRRVFVREVRVDAATQAGVAWVDVDGATLWRRSVAIERALRRAGVGRGAVVALDMPRGADLCASMVAVRAVGAAWAGLDPGWPEGRRAALCARIGAAARLDAAAVAAAVAVQADDDPLPGPDDCGSPAARGSLGAALHDDDDRSYIVFTSGSTGQPRAAANTMRGLRHLLAAWSQTPGLRQRGWALACSSPAFDMSVLQWWAPLLAGGAVVSLDDVVLRDPALAAAGLADSPVCDVLLPPSTWRLLRSGGWRPAAGASVTFGGELLPDDVVADALACCDEVWNGWGVSEAAACTTIARLRDDVLPPAIGRPFAGAEVRVCAEGAADASQPLPPGVIGELWIAGAGVGVGYLGDAAATAERFCHGAYRTGDRGYVERDGVVACLGRLDEQVKVRGQRVEPAEVEAALRALPGVAATAVIALAGAEGHSLHAAVVPASGEPLDVDALRRDLAAQLPSAWLPAGYWLRAVLPLGHAGKVDRQALRAEIAAALATRGSLPPTAPLAADEAMGSRPPTPVAATDPGPIDAVLALCRDAVGDSTLHADADLPRAGLDSLSAARLALHLGALAGEPLAVTAIWQRGSARALAALLRDSAAESRKTNRDLSKPSPPSSPAQAAATRPLIAAELALWLAEQLAPHDPAQRVRADVDVAWTGADPRPGDPQSPDLAAALRSALAAVVARQPGLRTAFVVGATQEAACGPAALVVPDARVELIDLRLLADADPVAAASAAAALEGAPFDLSRPPLLRALLLPSPPPQQTRSEQALGAALTDRSTAADAVIGAASTEPVTHATLRLLGHHIALDGLGVAALVRDLGLALTGAALPPLTTLAASGASPRPVAGPGLDGDHGDHGDHGDRRCLHDPDDRDDVPQRGGGGRGVSVHRALAPALWRGLYQRARALRATPQMAWLGLVAAFRASRIGGSAAVVSTVFAERHGVDAEAWVAHCAAVVPLRVAVAVDASLDVAVVAGRDALLAAMSRGSAHAAHGHALAHQPGGRAAASSGHLGCAVLVQPPPPAYDGEGPAGRVGLRANLAPSAPLFGFGLELEPVADGATLHASARAPLSADLASGAPDAASLSAEVDALLAFIEAGLAAPTLPLPDARPAPCLELEARCAAQVADVLAARALPIGDLPGESGPVIALTVAGPTAAVAAWCIERADGAMIRIRRCDALPRLSAGAVDDAALRRAWRTAAASDRPSTAALDRGRSRSRFVAIDEGLDALAEALRRPPLAAAPRASSESSAASFAAATEPRSDPSVPAAPAPPAVCQGPQLRPSAGGPRTLPALMARAARRRAGVTCSDRDGAALLTRTAADLQSAAAAAAAALPIGAAPVAVVAGEPWPLLVGAWAAILAGRPALLLPTEIDAAGLRQALDDAGADAVFAPIALTDALRAAAVAAVDRPACAWFGLDAAGQVVDAAPPAVASPLHPDAPQAAVKARRVAPDAIALLLRTSGSSGRPKLVAHSHRTLLAQCDAWGQHQGFTASDRFLSWLPLDHVASFVMYHLQPLWQGGHQAHLPPGPVLARPLRWLEALHEARATVTWAPNFAVASLLAAADAAAASPGAGPAVVKGCDLKALRMVLLGGEAVVPETTRRLGALLRAHGADSLELSPGWGMSETASAVVTRGGGDGWRPDLEALGAADGAAPEMAALMALGLPLPGVTIEVRDADDGALLRRGEVGRLFVRGPMLLRGYWRRDGDGPPSLHSPLDALQAFDTGDLASLGGDGALRIVGRGDDALVVQGVVRPAVALEVAALQTGIIAPGEVAAFSARRSGEEREGIGLAFVPAGRATLGALDAAACARLRLAVVEATGLQLRWLVQLRPGELPRTALGKVQRQTLRARLEAGLLDGALVGADRSPRAAAGDDVDSEVAAAAPRSAVRWQMAPWRWPAPRFAPGPLRLFWAGSLVAAAAPDARVSAEPLAAELRALGWQVRWVDFGGAAPDAASHADAAPDDTPLVWVAAPAVDRGDDARREAVALGRLLAAAEPRRALVVSAEGRGDGALAASLLGGVLGPGRSLHLDSDHGLAFSIDHALRRPWHGEAALRMRGPRTATLRLCDAGADLLASADALRREPGVIAAWRVAIVGGTGGLGRALAALLLAHGARVLLVGRAARETDDAVRLLERQGQGRLAVACVGAAAPLASALEPFEATHGPISHLVMAAAAAGEPAFDARPGLLSVLSDALATRPRVHLVDLTSLHARLPPRPDALGGALAPYAAAAAAGLSWLEVFAVTRPIGEGPAVGTCAALLLPQIVDCGLSAGRAADPLSAALGMPALDAHLACAAVLAALHRPCGVVGVGVVPTGRALAAIAGLPLRLGPELSARRLDAQAAKAPGHPAAALAPLHTADDSASFAAAALGRVQSCWRAVLPDDADLDQGFFAAGGDSLALTRLAAGLEAEFQRAVPVAALLARPTAADQAAWLEGAAAAGAPGLAAGAPGLAAGAPGLAAGAGSRAIAIVGVAGRFGPAADVEAFWRAVVTGSSLVQRFDRDALLAAGLPPHVVDDPAFVPARAALGDPECFDAALFEVSPREATLTDPQHRVFLEVAAAALDDAALAPDRFEGAIGVYAGCAPNTWMLNEVLPSGVDPGGLGAIAAVVASDKDHLATRVAYKLGLRGPAIAVQTACSTGLIAVHLAVQALRTGDCDAAIAGGASIAFPTLAGHLWQRGGVTSRDGETRSFAADADGTASADAVAAVVLRRLDDALRDGDPIRAVLLGSASNNDGRDRLGYTAPGLQGQRQVIERALRDAGVDAGDIALVEAHGTATPLGDPLELQALQAALGPIRRGAPATRIGSAKSNLGHANTAAGVVGLIKATLALQTDLIPASRNLSAPCTELAGSARLQGATHTEPWPSAAARLCGVSSFGAGGTNAHVVLAAPPAPAAVAVLDAVGERAAAVDAAPTSVAAAAGDDGSPVEIVLQAHDVAGLERGRRALCAALGGAHADAAAPSGLASGRVDDSERACARDVAATLWRGRRRQRARAAWVVPGDLRGPALVAALEGEPDARGDAGTRARPVAFLLPGQGFQRVGGGRGAYLGDPAFAQAFDHACAHAAQHGAPDLRRFLALDAATDAHDEALQAELDDQRCAGAYTLALAHALGAGWAAQGVRPDAVLGQSTGELGAAVLAGVLTFEDAMHLAMARAALLDRSEPGAVLAVAAAAAALQPRLPEGAWVALRNGPAATVVAGRPPAIAELERALQAEGVATRRVRVSVAAHTPLLEPVAAPLTALVRGLTLRPPRIPIYSCVTGRRLSDAEACDPGHWARLTVQPADLQSTLEALAAAGDYALVELGLAGSMATPLRWTLSDRECIASLPAIGAEATTVLATLRGRRAAAICAGVALEPLGAAHDAGGRRLHLPGVPFARTRYGVRVAMGPSATANWAASLGGGQGPALSMAGDVGDALPFRPPGLPASTESLVVAGAGRPGRPRSPRPAQATPHRAAATAAEAAVIALVEDLLGIEGVGADDDFFALGGDSLVTMRLVEAARRRHGVELPASAVFTGFTAAQLARLFPAPPGATALPASRRDVAPSCLVPLQAGGADEPLFFVHPAAGVVFPYVELSRSLPASRPFYGLAAAGLDGQEPPDPDVPSMARRYIAAIRTVQPRGPYLLGAYSFGCYVAFEMALQLEAAGEEVAALVLVDEGAPLDGHRPTVPMMARLIFGRAGRSLGKHLLDYVRDRGRDRLRALGAPSLGPASLRRWLEGGADLGLDALLERLAMATLLPDQAHAVALDLPAMRPMFELLKLHLRHTLTYTPQGTIAARATLLRSSWVDERPSWLSGDVDYRYGWGALCRGGVEDVTIPGDHLAVIRQPHVKVLAAAVEASLQRASEPRRSPSPAATAQDSAVAASPTRPPDGPR